MSWTPQWRTCGYVRLFDSFLPRTILTGARKVEMVKDYPALVIGREPVNLKAFDTFVCLRCDDGNLEVLLPPGLASSTSGIASGSSNSTKMTAWVPSSVVQV